MNKPELVSKVAEQTGITKKQAGAAIDAALHAIEDALSQGERVQLVGFGSFSVAERAARTGRNPQTGKPLEIPAKKVPKFVAGRALKEAVK